MQKVMDELVKQSQEILRLKGELTQLRELCEIQHKAIGRFVCSRWLSIDFDHKRTLEACDIRGDARAALTKYNSLIKGEK